MQVYALWHKKGVRKERENRTDLPEEDEKEAIMLAETEKLLAQTWSISPALLQKAALSEKMTGDVRAERRSITEYNQIRVCAAFCEERVEEHHFAGSTGYGFHDSGRDTLDRLFARIFGGEEALVRWQFVSGTHALASILFGNLRPGDRWLSIVGAPYDTMHPVIDGKSQWPGSLHEWGIEYDEISLTSDHRIDKEKLSKALTEKTKLVYLQRSLGYTFRPSLSLEALAEAIRSIKALQPSCGVMVDNCYGEFVESREPLHCGADIIGGSLIKNSGGGIAPAGGYIAGKAGMVRRAAVYLTSPGIGPDEGATLGINRLLFQGLFMAPSVVGQAVEGAIWASHLLESLGFRVMPRWDEKRTDIIQAVLLGSPEAQRAFCRGIQKSSPVDSFAVPEAVSMPGYRDPIIMSGGTFIQGSSIELSADGPEREPYAVYLQGGLSYHHVKAGVLCALQELQSEGLLPE